MKQLINDKRSVGQLMFMMILINAVIVQHAYVENANLYWLLILTVPLLIFSAVRLSFTRTKIRENGSIGTTETQQEKQRSGIIKTTNYDYAKFR